MNETAAVDRPVAVELTRPARRQPSRLGFLGVGWIGRNRLEALQRSGLAEIAVVADSATEIAEAVASATGAILCHNLEGVLDAEIDGVVIATPSALHAPQSIAALDRGLAVFCQKPLARTTNEACQVIDAAITADRLLGLDLSYRHLRGVTAIRERILNGDLGEIFSVNLVFHNAYGPDKPWFYDRRLSGGGCLMDLGTHLLDLVFWMLPGISAERVTGRLYSQGIPWRPDLETVEDYATARIDLNTGAAVDLTCSWRLPLGADARIEAWFFGTKAGACIHNVAGSFFDFRTEWFHGTHREILAEPPEAWGGAAAIAWATQLASSPRYDPAVQTILQTTRVIDSLYQE